MSQPGLKHIYRLILLSLFVATGTRGFATNYISIASGDWSNPSIWSPSGIPGTNDNVIIDYGYTVTGSGSISISSIEVRSILNLSSDLNLSGAITLAGGSTFQIGGNFNLPGNFNTNGTVSIGGNCIVGGYLSIPGSSTLNFSVGGFLQVNGNITNNGISSVSGNCTSLNGFIINSDGCHLNIGGSLHSKTGLNNTSGTLNVGQSCIVDGGGVNNANGGTIHVGNGLTVAGGLANEGNIIVDGNFNLNSGTLTIGYSDLIVVNGSFSKNGDITINGTLIVTGDFISNGGSTSINQYNGNFYAFQVINENGTQAGCTTNCFPKETCDVCQIKGLGAWESAGQPNSNYVTLSPSWWTNHLDNMGQTVGPTNICPSSSSTFKVPAVTTDAGDMASNIFEWAVYGGTITGFNGTSISTHSGTVSGHTASFQSVHGISGTTEYTLNVQWESTSFSGAYVAVRQTSEYSCSDSKWSVYKINLQDITAPTGSSAQSFCEGATVANLSATGSNIKWYTTSSGESAFASSTLLTSGTYYGSQTVSGCESIDRFAVSVTILATNTVGPASSSPIVCVNTAITPITHTTTGATGIGSATGLPTGVSASWTSNTITISGTPSVSGTFNYSIPLSGGCGTVTATGTITVDAQPTTASISTTKFNYVGTLTTNTLGGITPSTGNGVWSITSGGTGTFSAQTNGNSTFTAGSTGTYVIRWTITNGTCSNFAEVTIHFYNETTWNGSASTAWANVLNWTPNEIPDGSNSILVPLTTNNPVISGSSPANDVSISGHLNIKDGATLTLEAGPVLKLNATANASTLNGSKIIIKSDGSYINLSTSSPTLKMERLLTGVKGWRMVSSPVSTTYSDMFKAPLVTQGFTGSTYPSKQPNLLLWNETDAGTSLQSWRNPGGFSSAIPAGEGHFHYIFNGAGITEGGTYSDVLPQTMTVTGNENALGGHSFSLTYTLRDLSNQSSGNYTDRNIADQGWNLKGNPTASTLDWDLASGWTKTNIDNTIYIWDPSANGGNGEYLTWNGVSGTLGNGRIAPFQAFWVHANTNSPGLSFTNLAKSTTNGNFLKTASIDNSVIVPITLSGEGMETTSILLLSENGVTGPDTWDGYRLEPMSDSWLALYMRSSLSYNEPLVINDLPLSIDNEYIPLYVDAQKDGQKIGGSFTIQWEIPKNWPEELSLQLMDHTQKKAISMLQFNEYKFDQVATKNAVIEAINPLDVPTQLIKYNNTENKLKTTESLPFSIVIGRNTTDPVYQDKVPVLFTNYPNPFSESTTIRFSLPDTAPVQIDIFDVYGRLLETPFKGSLPSGIHNIDWTPATNVSGILFIRLTSNKTVLSVKALKKR